MADGLNPGEKGHNLSVVIEAPSSELDKVRLAQYRWYVSDSGK
jgi:hypothetical protein